MIDKKKEKRFNVILYLFFALVCASFIIPLIVVRRVVK